ncbi:MAG TPA: response regulator transcription factor [Actinotalea sp.]|jgi:DNA-binding NarL/FixJ family response regulator
MTPDRDVRAPRVGTGQGSGTGSRLVRVLVADDDALVRSALSMVLDEAAGVVLVGEVADGDEVPAAVAAHAPDVVLMDIRMPRVDGLTATERLRRQPGAPEVIVLTTFDVDDYVLRALRAGAGGFLLKDTRPADIVAAVHKVVEGEAMLSPAITRRLIDLVTAEPAAPSPRSGPSSEDLLARLTERERDVAVAVGRGLSNAEIGAEVYLSVATVKTYVSRVLTKLELTNRVQVALLVHGAGLTGER